MVLSTSLFDKPPFKNLIVNGLVLAGDGKKMSKRLKNYPDPNYILQSYGADALRYTKEEKEAKEECILSAFLCSFRLYLVNSPVVRAEPMKFKEEGVGSVIRDVFLPWFNAYRFFVENCPSEVREYRNMFLSSLSFSFFCFERVCSVLRGRGR